VVVRVPDLTITPARRRLLADIDAGLVHQHIWLDQARGYFYSADPDPNRPGRRQVTVRVQELVDAELVRPPDELVDGALPTLTGAGLAALRRTGGGSR
jgi:hypothetical protein